MIDKAKQTQKQGLLETVGNQMIAGLAQGLAARQQNRAEEAMLRLTEANDRIRIQGQVQAAQAEQEANRSQGLRDQVAMQIQQMQETGKAEASMSALGVSGNSAGDVLQAVTMQHDIQQRDYISRLEDANGALGMQITGLRSQSAMLDAMRKQRRAGRPNLLNYVLASGIDGLSKARSAGLMEDI